MKKLCTATATLVAVITAMVLFASPGNTHANTVNGTAECNPTTGKFHITWTITNDHPLPESSSSRLGAVNIPANGTRQWTESGPVGTYQLDVHGVWSDGFEGDASGQVTTSGDCTIPPPHDECPNIPDNQPEGYDCTPETETPPVVKPPKAKPPVKHRTPSKVITHKDSGLPNTGA